MDRVVIPGMEGVYGITAGHTPIVSEMKPGVVDIVHAAVRSGACQQSGGGRVDHELSCVLVVQSAGGGSDPSTGA